MIPRSSLICAASDFLSTSTTTLSTCQHKTKRESNTKKLTTKFYHATIKYIFINLN